jgi:hypothetical protein
VLGKERSGGAQELLTDCRIDVPPIDANCIARMFHLLFAGSSAFGSGHIGAIPKAGQPSGLRQYILEMDEEPVA